VSRDDIVYEVEHQVHAYQLLAVSLSTVYIPLFATINQRLLYGKCFSNGSCDGICNNFRKSVVPDDVLFVCMMYLHMKLQTLLIEIATLPSTGLRCHSSACDTCAFDSQETAKFQ
jgi:hypothetical protein